MQIKVSKDNYQPVLNDYEIEFLAEVYAKIKKNKIFLQRWNTFERFVNEFMKREGLRMINKWENKGG